MPVSFCTAEVRGSTPLDSTQKYADLQVKRRASAEATDLSGASYCNRYCNASSKVYSALFCGGGDDQFDRCPSEQRSERWAGDPLPMRVSRRS
jgi:hypothetical protein